MQSKKYPLEKGGQPRLEISWKGSPIKCKHVAISVDGQEIGTIANQKLMEEGQKFSLQDGSILEVKLNRGMLIDFMGICKWETSLNGEIIPDPDFEPAQKHKSAYAISPESYIFRGLFLYVMWQGLGAIRKLNRNRA